MWVETPIMKHFLLTILLLLFVVLFARGQETFNFQLSAFNFPWSGGLNACQFGRMDLDNDGKKDLLVFDRHGNRLSCFINKGAFGVIDYQYTTEFDYGFPELNDWVIFSDYDGDGKEDIFTYSNGWAGIKVYRNVTDDGHIGFQLVKYPYLTSWQGGGEVNILATNADYPSLVDLDGDGDLDILTFGVMGTFIEKHLNLSKERYGCLDSLVFECADLCWGKVAESEENNMMYLDTCLFGYGITMLADGTRHRGATVTIHDLNGDGLLDLLLADVDYPGLTLLVNGGDPENALMVNQMDFPPQYPVKLPSMPVPYFTDIDNDGDDDLLVSPFDPDPMASEGFESIWLYLNHGTNDAPDFRLYTKSFLQDNMLDFGTGAFPVIVDWDGDGLLDIVVGSIRGSELVWLKNAGTATQPAFRITEFPFGFGEYTGLVPAFYDLDGDGQQELLVGTAEGKLLLYDHDGTLLDDDYLHYDKAWSAPCFFDVDHDGVVDLVVGNETGRLSFYKGSEALGVRSEEYWGGVDVRDYSTSYYGYSVPTLFQWGDEILLAVGSESGKVFLFDGVTTEENAVFHEASERWFALCGDMPETFGMRSSSALEDLDNDGRLDIVVGNFSGGMQLFNTSISINNLEIAEQQEEGTVLVFPNPVDAQCHIISNTECIKQLLLMDLFGRVLCEQSVGGRECLLEVTDLHPGVYLLRLTLERGAVNRIFLKR